MNSQPRAVLRQNQFGFTLGGPVKRDKLLLFTSYQGTRQSNGVDPRCSSNYNSPPLTNDRSAAALGALFAGQPTFTQLIGIPGGATVAPDGSNISPQALALLNQKLPNGQFLIPTPQTVNANAPFAVQGFSSFSIPCTFNEDQFIADADFLPSARSVFYARFFFANSDQKITLPPSPLGAGSPGFAGPVNQRFRNASLAHNYIFSSKLLNQAEIGYHRQVSSTGQDEPFSFSSIGSAAPPFSDNLPNIAINGSLALGGGGQTLLLIQNTYVAQDTLSWVRGRHSFRFGGGATRVQNNVESFQFLGGLLFGSFPDFLLGQSAAQNGTPLSNILLSINVGGLFPRKFRVWDGTAYAQDDFKLTQHLTLNLGFRYERLGDIGDELGRNANFDPARANPNPPAGGSFAGFVVPSNFSGGALPPGVVSTGNNLGIRGDNQNTFDPRVGFAWQAARNVVLRGGYGIYHSRLTNQPLFQLLTNQPFSSITQLQAFANGAASFANPFPSTAPFTPGFTPYSPTTQQSPIFIAQGLRPPMLQRYSLNTQTAMGAGLIFELGYVGTRAIHLIRSRSVNQAGLASPSSPIRGETTNTLANIAQRVPLEGFTPGNLSVLETEGSSNYNALEASLTKRFRSGLQFLASYTWSKALSTDSASTTGPNGGFAVGDQNNPRARYGPDDFIRPQRFILSGVYALPTLERHGFLVREALGGWKLSGVTTLQSGQQLAVTQTNPTNTFGITNNFAQLAPACSNLRVGTPGGVTSRLNNYINASCFTDPPVVGPDGSTGFGNTKPGILKGPDQINTDLSLAKLFPLGFIHEKSNVEFRVEAFNVFNHAQFANPTTDVALPTFGHIQSTAVAPRVVQLALKLNF